MTLSTLDAKIPNTKHAQLSKLDVSKLRYALYKFTFYLLT